MKLSIPFRVLCICLCMGIALPICTLAQKRTEQTTKYTVQPGETMLGIAHRHGTSLDHLLSLNPGLTADYVQSGQTITVPVTDGTASTSAVNISYKQVGVTQERKPIVSYKEYKVKRKDTAYSLAKANNITVEQLMEANPAMREEGYKLKKGTVIRIPVFTLPPEPVYTGIGTLRVAVVLPFAGTGVENMRSVEFYRGMLMGLDDLRQAGANITLNAYNEPAADMSIATLMSEITAQKPDIIVGPLYPTHFNDVTAASGKKTKVAVPFSSKVPQADYRSDVFVINTPAAYETSLQAELFCKNFGKDTRVVLLHAQGGDKADFIQTLQARLTNAHYNTTRVAASSTAAQVKAALNNPAKADIVLLPDDSSEATMRKMLSLAKSLRTLLLGCNISVVGYEPWITLSEHSDIKQLLHEADTYVFTPNYFYPYTTSAMAFTASYKKWFKTDLLDSKPRMAPLGYDFSRTFLANMVIYGYDYGTQPGKPGTLAAEPKLQTDLRFMPIKGGGYVSSSMWIVHFKRDMSIVKISAL